MALSAPTATHLSTRSISSPASNSACFPPTTSAACSFRHTMDRPAAAAAKSAQLETAGPTTSLRDDPRVLRRKRVSMMRCLPTPAIASFSSTAFRNSSISRSATLDTGSMFHARAAPSNATLALSRSPSMPFLISSPLQPATSALDCTGSAAIVAHSIVPGVPSTTFPGTRAFRNAALLTRRTTATGTEVPFVWAMSQEILSSTKACNS